MKQFFATFYHLNRMGRIEGPPLAGILLLAGAVYAGLSITLSIALAAFFMFFFCMNYVYLINGVTDVKEDAINSPERPLARGLVSMKTAKLYTWALFVITLIYPFFVHTTWAERSIVWIILLMGYFYSVPPVRFKRFPPLATIYLVANFNLPLVLGYWMATTSSALPPFLASTVLLFLANMPLKDYGDRHGDAQAGVSNWVQVAGGTKNLLLLSTGLSIMGVVICYFVLPADMLYRTFFVLLPILPALNIILHQLLKINMDRMFTHGVRLLILMGGVYLVAYWLMKM